jgi:peptide/nickel transport system permease protein
MLGHILPNVLTPALIFYAGRCRQCGAGAALATSVSASKIPPRNGKMIADSQNFMVTSWWLPTFPGVAIVFFGVGLSLLGDSVADMFRPGD